MCNITTGKISSNGWVTTSTYYAPTIKFENQKELIPKYKKIISKSEVKMTIIIWEDNSKTIVKASDNDTFDEENGIAMAFIKKIFGSHSAFKKYIKVK